MPWRPLEAETLPDRGLTHAFAPSLPGGRFSGPLVAFASVPSTQTLCRVWAAGGAPEGTVVVADHQSEGRGRRGRTWTAAPGTSLLFSCLLRPPWPPARWPQLGLLAGCAVAEATEAVAGLPARLRWPNDVLVEGRKLAGILAEGVVGERPSVILGVGVNVCQRAEEWPPELAGLAVSLAALGADVTREALLAAILRRLAIRYEGLFADGFGPVREAWRDRALLGAAVRTAAGEAIALDLAQDGGLVVRYPDGTLRTVVADVEVEAAAASSGSR